MRSKGDNQIIIARFQKLKHFSRKKSNLKNKNQSFKNVKTKCSENQIIFRQKTCKYFSINLVKVEIVLSKIILS